MSNVSAELSLDGWRRGVTRRTSPLIYWSVACLARNTALMLAAWDHLPMATAVPRTQLTWVNGIGYNSDHMLEAQVEIQKMFGGKYVDFCHNPTSMSSDYDLKGYFGDLTQAGTQKLGWITTEVELLVRHLKTAVATVGRKGRVVHIAHSQGALITTLAAKNLTALEMNQIEVIAFGGAAAIRKTKSTPFRRCINYYSVNDPLLWVVPSAEQALRSGLVVDDEFCFLAPRIGDPIADHQLLGPTYRQALIWEGQRFQREYQSLVYRLTRAIIVFLIAFMKQLAHLTTLIKISYKNANTKIHLQRKNAIGPVSDIATPSIIQ